MFDARDGRAPVLVVLVILFLTSCHPVFQWLGLDTLLQPRSIYLPHLNFSSSLL